MALFLSFLSNLHQTEREYQRISDAASPTPISDPTKISELKTHFPNIRIHKQTQSIFPKIHIIKSTNTHAHFVAEK
jgi:hypothetical protein